jgi:hypothetical protein
VQIQPSIVADGGLLARATPPEAGAKKALEGLYKTSARSGADVVVHANQDAAAGAIDGEGLDPDLATLALVGCEHRSFAISKPGCTADSDPARLVPEGYWRYLDATDTGLIRLFLEPDALGQALCAGEGPWPVTSCGATLCAWASMRAFSLHPGPIWALLPSVSVERGVSASGRGRPESNASLSSLGYTASLPFCAACLGDHMDAQALRKYLDVLCDEIDAHRSDPDWGLGRLRRTGVPLALAAALGLNVSLGASCAGESVPLYAAVVTDDSGDSGCTGDSDCGETSCNDKIDNDHDSFVDCADPDCYDDIACSDLYAAPPAEDCDNKIDDDGDKLIDCDDDDCIDDLACASAGYRAPPA